MYLTWKKGSGDWGISEQKPCNFSHDFWGPFDNKVTLKLKEYELRGLLTISVRVNDQMELVECL